MCFRPNLGREAKAWIESPGEVDGALGAGEDFVEIVDRLDRGRDLIGSRSIAGARVDDDAACA